MADAATAKGARFWPEVHADLAPFLSVASVVLAWNAEFDRRMLFQTARRHRLKIGSNLPMRDAMAGYRELRGEGCARGRHSLSPVAACERIGSYEAHRAIGDCRAVFAVMRAVADRQENETAH